MWKLVLAITLSCFTFSFMLVGSAAAQCGPSGLPNVGEAPARWWPADDTTLDIVTGTQGTLENGAGYGLGVIGQAFSFNGEAQGVTVPNSRAWDFGACDFSIMVWAKVSDATLGAPLVSHDESGGPYNKWIFWVQPSDYGYGLVFHAHSSKWPDEESVNVGYGGFLPTAGFWYHFAVTRSGNLYVLYVNGLPVASATDSHKTPSANASLMIGRAEAFAFNGLIDEVKIYHRALSAAEVRTLGFMQGAAAVAGQ